jgi:hypothetical protein
MKTRSRLALIAALAAPLALIPAARADEAPFCKNHYILSEPCNLAPKIAWETLPDSIMAHGRAHTATRLADGRVLVVGGSNWNPVTRTGTPIGAETYDPVSREWRATGPMHRWRVNHEAVRLVDGRVLVVGGEQIFNQNYVGDAEVFDPASNTWAATGNLQIPRGGFTASLLPGGRVLVVGGVDSGDNALASAEIWDPESGTWRLTGSLVEPRLVHTATALPDGRVIVVGGMVDDFFMWTTGTAEVFDPATETWSLAGAIAPRWLHSATLTEKGEVLVAGGYISQPESGPGGYGWYQASEIGSTAIYDPSASTWRSAGDLNKARHQSLAVPLRGQGVLLFGGAAMVSQIPRYAQVPVERPEFLGPDIGAWLYVEAANAPPASAGDYYSAAPLDDGTVLFVGDVAGARALLLRY